ncbi:hypothetical protein B566_EDAN008291 [Ephemera danica]|nr:hypothetical protein B566_EDAN008291 [Ephemera danica]
MRDVDYDDSLYLPEMSAVSISQSVEMPLTLQDVVTLSGQASSSNGTGNGGVNLTWQRLLGPRGRFEMEAFAGQGPGLALRAFCTLSRHVYSNYGVAFHGTPKGIAPALTTGKSFAMQMSEHTLGTLTWRAGLVSSMSVSLARDTASMHWVAMLQVGVPHSFALISYTRKLESGNVKLGIRGGTFGMQIEYGAEKKVTKHTTVSATVTVGIPVGVSLKLRIVRANYTFSFPIHLSEELVPAAIFYGTVTPVLAWLIVKSAIIDPYVAKQKAKERERHREANRSRVAEKRREAEASVKLMRTTFERVRKEEESKQGLVIIEAVYFPLPGVPPSETAGQSTPPEPNFNPLNRPDDAIDVTIQLQCLVRSSKLTLHEASKSELPGFYDPSLGDQKQLYVKYLFRGQLHEIAIGDMESLRIPRTTHRVGDV